MTDRSDQHSTDDAALARRVKALPNVEARPAFREALRDAFVAGTIDGRDSIPDVPRRRRSFPRWMATVGATAVAAVLVLFAVTRPALEVVEVAGTGTIVVDGTAYTLPQERATLDLAVDGGANVEVGDGVTLDLKVAGTVLYEVTSGTTITLPRSPRRWLGRSVTAHLSVGELRLKTGRRFPGVELTVRTPEGLIEVTGTLLSVAADEEGTCVCVLEGVALVGTGPADLEAVSPGFRKVMLRSGEVKVVPVKEMHRDGVLEFERRVGDHLD